MYTSREACGKIRGKVKHASREGEGFHSQTNLPGAHPHTPNRTRMAFRFLVSFPVNRSRGKSLYRRYDRQCACEPQSKVIAIQFCVQSAGPPRRARDRARCERDEPQVCYYDNNLQLVEYPSCPQTTLASVVSQES